MRVFLRVILLPVAAVLSVSFLPSQSAMPLPGCEPSPEVQKIMDEKLDPKALDKMKLAERTAYERRVLEGLIEKYPRELTPYESLRSRVRFYAPEDYPALREAWVKRANDNPGDPLALLLAGESLQGEDTAEAIRLIEEAKAKAPNFPWPKKQLAAIYFSGKLANKAKLDENLDAFFAACPASTDSYAQWLLTKDQPLQPKVAAALRARLEKETDPKRLEDYGTLWGLEFRNRPPKEHDAVRAQVAQDLKRLEALNPKGDAEWLEFAVKGYKQSGATEETVTAVEDRLIREYPHSGEAYAIVSDRWDTSHKKPEDEADAAAWTKYQKEYEEALKGWLRDYPDEAYLQQFEWFNAISSDDAIPEKEGVAALEAYVQNVKDYQPASVWFWELQSAVQFLLDHHWEPERALELAKQAGVAMKKERASQQKNDNRTEQELKDEKDQALWQDQLWCGMVLQASMQAGSPEEAVKLQAQVEAPAPADKKYQSGYWFNRARFEAIENHKQDALAYYQLALQTRAEPPEKHHGKLRDELTNEARALWRAQGGTEAAWAVWSKPASGSADQLAEGRWEKPTKPIPEFALSDLSGKTWKLKELEGKTILINLWATWCGPCQAELPHLEKFYEKVKNRSDIQVLTFDIDEDLGLVDPFVKKKGFTFPVLPAYSTVVSLLDGFAIPQTWLVDGHGTWQWKQIGYGGGTDADLEKDLLERVDSTKIAQ